jgi:antirestriction protein ArdC
MKESAYQLITGRIIKLMQQGVVPWRQGWEVRRAWPCNLVSRKRYQGINAFLLHSMAYESPYWVTFRQARELGGSVRKCEKSTPIVLWKKIEIESPITKEKEKKLLLRYWSVFNVAQCDGLSGHVPAPEPDFPPLNPLTEAARIVENMPNPPAIKHGLAKAFYSVAGDYVGLPAPSLFTSQEEYFSTLFHELGHSTGHEKRLNRELLKAALDDPTDYPREELCAEMTSAFLCAEAGIAEATIENSAAYIKAWLKHLKDDAKLVVHAAAQAQKAADYILNRKGETELTELTAGCGAA